MVNVMSSADYSPFKDGQKRFRPETGAHLLPKLALLIKESSLLTSVTSKTSLLTKALANPDISPATRKILKEMMGAL